MKSVFVYILVSITLIAAGYFLCNSTIISNEETVIKNKEMSYDSLYTSSLNKNIENLSNKIKELHKANGDLAKTILKLKNKPPQIIKDTISIYDTIIQRDTVVVVYSSPFRVGDDTLNCGGIVSTDMNRFYFSNIKFNYPEKIITKTSIIQQPNWTVTAIGVSVGVIIGLLIK